MDFFFFFLERRLGSKQHFEHLQTELRHYYYICNCVSETDWRNQVPQRVTTPRCDSDRVSRALAVSTVQLEAKSPRGRCTLQLQLARLVQGLMARDADAVSRSSVALMMQAMLLRTGPATAVGISRCLSNEANAFYFSIGSVSGDGP